MEGGWCRLKRDDEVIEGEYYGTADGLVKIMKKQKIKKNGGAKSLNHRTAKQKKEMCSPTDGTSYL